jgi:glycosyltransferase involved in cell wall biosynthesis
MNRPRFTFCVPNLNKIKYLPACIQSILNQECGDWKCVFVDGHSTDGSWEYMQQFASDPRFILVRGQQQGMYADWNECLKYVDTDYFYFLTSDDTCYPKLISTTVKALDAHPDIDVCHFQFAFIDQDGNIITPFEKILEERLDLYCDVNKYAHRRSGLCEFMMHFVYRTLYITITSLVFRRNLIEKMKGFSTIHGFMGDYDWTMRLGLFTDVLYIPELLATWRKHEEQSTYNLYSSPHLHKNWLRIAEANLDYFAVSEKVKLLKNPLNKQYILSDLLNNYTYYLYRQIHPSKSLFSNIEYLYLFFKSDPFYFIKKSIRRLSRNRLYTYYQKKVFAYNLINKYDLKWPPVKVDIPKNKVMLSQISNT